LAWERVDIAKKEDASYEDLENADADGGAEADADDTSVGTRVCVVAGGLRIKGRGVDEADADDAGVGARETVDDEER
jgi:hypothetical protein